MRENDLTPASDELPHGIPAPMRIVIAAGGTGGHLFPGIAIAQAFMEKNKDNRVLFVSIGKSFEKRVLANAGFPLECITSEALKGRGRRHQIKALWKIPKGIYESGRILKHFRPQWVVGLGSYTSAPLIFSAWLMGIPIVLHEQNIMPGLTNRALAPFADRIYLSFEQTQSKGRQWPGGRMARNVRITGNPIREEIVLAARSGETAPEPGGKAGRPFTVLILGGSQGAHRINTAMTEVGNYLKNNGMYFFVHQTGSKDESQTHAAYRQYGISCEVKPFFDDMVRLYRQADLVVCRAGATTIAEITAMGKGVVFIPYPYAADDHQTKNARKLAEAGAAEMIRQNDLDGETLARRIEYYAVNRQALKAMAARAKAFGRPNAAKDIVEDCYQTFTGGKKGASA